QNVRKSVLLTCLMVLVYDVIEHSVGGVVYESVAIISAIIGLIRFRRKED
ncbi:MAG: YgjV family protein, partial [Clostridia bacterium]|nr:YgjV family protein [Clostridia bacterium]